jgi:hypothetical protein
MQIPFPGLIIGRGLEPIGENVGNGLAQSIGDRDRGPSRRLAPQDVADGICGQSDLGLKGADRPEPFSDLSFDVFSVH